MVFNWDENLFSCYCSCLSNSCVYTIGLTFSPGYLLGYAQTNPTPQVDSRLPSERSRVDRPLGDVQPKRCPSPHPREASTSWSPLFLYHCTIMSFQGLRWALGPAYLSSLRWCNSIMLLRQMDKKCWFFLTKSWVLHLHFISFILDQSDFS